MKRKPGVILGGVLFGAMCVLGMLRSFWPPGGPIDGPGPRPGLSSACTLLDPARQQQLVPEAKASRRTLTRRISECTLTGGGRELIIKIHEHSGAQAARHSYQTDEDIQKRYSRNFTPPLEFPALGEQACLSLSFGGGSANAMVMARKGIRVVEVRYALPATIPVGKGSTDPKHYAAAKSAAVEVAGELLK